MRGRNRESGQVTNEWIIIVVLLALVAVIGLGMYGRTIAAKFICAAKSVTSGQGLAFSCPGDAGAGDKGGSGEDGADKDAPARGMPGPSGGGGGGGAGSGGSGSPQDKLDAARELVRQTPEGKKLLDSLDANNVPITLGSGDGASFNPASNAITIDESYSLEHMIFYVAHEATHAQRHNEGNTGDLLLDTRDEYVDKMLAEETDGTVVAIEIKELIEAGGTPIGATFPGETAYKDAFRQKHEELTRQKERDPRGNLALTRTKIREEAKKAGRAAVRKQFDNGTLLPSTNRNITYPEFYRRKHDAGVVIPVGQPGPQGAGGAGGSAGTAPPKVHDGQQGKHIPGHPNFIEGRSILSADPAKLAERAGTGTPVNNVARGEPGFKERIDFAPDVVGMFVKDGVAVATTKVIAHYGKNGVHFVPAAP